MAAQPLKVIGYMKLKDGRTVPVDDLTETEVERCQKSMSERLGRVMSEYFTRNIDEYKNVRSIRK